MLAPKKPVDVLRAIAAPRELIEWVRKMPADEAVRRAWIDVTRADWLPYLAILRGISKDAVIRATCTCARELSATALATPPGDRVAAFFADASTLANAEPQLEDLRLQMLAQGENAAPWMLWCRIALDLGRAIRRGNPLVGVALALRVMTTAGGRRGSSDLVARFRDELLMA